jgi:hypothetical protein
MNVSGPMSEIAMSGFESLAMLARLKSTVIRLLLSESKQHMILKLLSNPRCWMDIEFVHDYVSVPNDEKAKESGGAVLRKKGYIICELQTGGGPWWGGGAPLEFILGQQRISKGSTP